MSDERTYKMLLADIAGGGSGGGGLPDYSEANDGDVLAIESGEPSWASPASGLPDYSGASDGDVLTLDNGEPTWAAPSGGGGGSTVNISADLILAAGNAVASAITKHMSAQTYTVGTWKTGFASGFTTEDDYIEIITALENLSNGIVSTCSFGENTGTLISGQDYTDGFTYYMATVAFPNFYVSATNWWFNVDVAITVVDRGDEEPDEERYGYDVAANVELVIVPSQG